MVFAMNGKPIQLKKLFHHKGSQKEIPSIELGSIVLYLDQYPHVSSTVTKHGKRIEQVFFLPEIEIKAKEALDAIERINQEKNMLYSIAISQTQDPQKGLKIRVTYNNEDVGISHSRFDSISLQKGLVFRFYNKPVIKKIRSASKPIIHMAHNNTPRVVIDCGHGGSDYGAIGCTKIQEKNVSLQVGLQVADLLKAKNIAVDLTRDTDRLVRLDERTSLANSQKADLFVSIHANAAPDKMRSGIETYCLSANLFTTEAPNDEDALLGEQLIKKYDRSIQLAEHVHQSLLAAVRLHCQVNDRQINYAVAQVLLGAAMPAILVEIGYLTHEQEAQLLVQHQYQSYIADGIVRGIDAYINHA